MTAPGPNTAFKAVVGVVVGSFSLYSMTGCGGSDTLRHLEKYENRPYTEVGVFYANEEFVYRAAIRGLQEESYLVTLSDPMTGLINAEKNSATPIPEDQKAISESRVSPSAGAIIVGVLVVIITLGLVLILSGSSNDKDEASDQKRADRESERGPTYVAAPPPEKTTSYRYIVSLTFVPMGADSTEVNISATKIFLENGGVLSSVHMDNKYLNYGIFDRISEQLRNDSRRSR